MDDEGVLEDGKWQTEVMNGAFPFTPNLKFLPCKLHIWTF